MLPKTHCHMQNIPQHTSTLPKKHCHRQNTQTCCLKTLPQAKHTNMLSENIATFKYLKTHKNVGKRSLPQAKCPKTHNILAQKHCQRGNIKKHMNMLPKIALPQTKYSNTQRRIAPKKGQVKYPKSHKHVAQKDCNRQSKNAQICCPRKHTKRPKTYNNGAKKNCYRQNVPSYLCIT